MNNQSTKTEGTAAAIVRDENGKRLLLVSDAQERWQRLESALGSTSVKMTKAASADEIAQVCRHDHDLAIIDVASRDLVEVLKTLRESGYNVKMAVLVENSRLTYEPSLAGILPAYRAMPCSYTELMKLAQRRLNSGASPIDAKPRGIRGIL